LPLDQLRTYAGRNPKPADFDAFWDDSLAEMHALDGAVDLVPSEFTTPFAECFDLWFTGVGGARVYAKYARPKGANDIPAILQFHGYTANSGDWNGLMGWVAAGCAVAAMDCRGQGGKSQDSGSPLGNTHNGHIIRGLDDPSPRNQYYRNVFLDTAQLARIVMDLPEVDPARVGATGGSQGGGLALACASLEPRIRRVTPTFPFLCDYQRVWEMDLDVGAYAELRTFFRHFDPLHLRHDAIFERLGYIDVQHLTPRIQGEVLMGLGLMDTITPPSTCFAAFNKITAPKDVVIFPDFGHEGLPGFGDRSYQFHLRP
jgi:cephalosporin-C deacetylase